jgi:hypothetical protein
MRAEQAEDRPGEQDRQQRRGDEQAGRQGHLAPGQPSERHRGHLGGCNASRQHAAAHYRAIDEPAGQPRERGQGHCADSQHKDQAARGRPDGGDLSERQGRPRAEHEDREGGQDRVPGIDAASRTRNRDAQRSRGDDQGQQKPVQDVGEPRQPGRPRPRAGLAIVALHRTTVPELHTDLCTARLSQRCRRRTVHRVAARRRCSDVPMFRSGVIVVSHDNSRPLPRWDVRQ